MKREILFRGKRIDNGEWVYGLLSFVGTYNGKPAEKITDFECEEIRVFPKTRGEYTGLTDRNGKRIFEGDIITVKTSGGTLFQNSVVKWDNKHCCGFVFESILSRNKYPMDGRWCYEVIGNIHDNLEMLGG